MKYVLLGVLLLSVKLVAQSPLDSLKKYSYLFKVNIPDSIKIISGVTYYKWYQ